MLSFLDKIFDWVPGRKESQRQEIDRLQREADELLKNRMDGRNYVQLQRITERLRNLREKIANAA